MLPASEIEQEVVQSDDQHSADQAHGQDHEPILKLVADEGDSQQNEADHCVCHNLVGGELQIGNGILCHWFESPFNSRCSSEWRATYICRSGWRGLYLFARTRQQNC